MNEIKLTNGGHAIVDDEDFQKLSAWKWHRNPGGYAARGESASGVTRIVLMARYLLSATEGQVVDHINRNKLDNRKSNLRITDQQANGMNRGKNKNNTSGFKGVSFSKRSGKFIANLHIGKRHIYLGSFDQAEDASAAYETAVKNHYP